jgi:hypothetical protein
MANTIFLKTKVEDYVRSWLADKFGTPFHSEFLFLARVQNRAARHEFDAVSEDKKIVCAIKTASWTTSGGKRGSGKIQGAYAELYFLDHISAEATYLILTDKIFFDNLSREIQGKLSEGLDLLFCELPDELNREIDAIRVSSRRELGF